MKEAFYWRDTDGNVGVEPDTRRVEEIPGVIIDSDLQVISEEEHERIFITDPREKIKKEIIDVLDAKK